jgi:TPR repeat protein
LPTDAPTAFFSYSRDASEFALRLAEDLKAAGANVWIDQLDIPPGQRWTSAVTEALNNSPRMLVILSPSAVSSTHVEDEVNFALEEQKTVIPVLYRDCKVSFQLRSRQYVNFRTDYAAGLKLLLKTLGVEQQAAASAAAASTAPKESTTTVSEEDERKRAAEQARLEEEPKQAAAEKVRPEQEECERLEQARGGVTSAGPQILPRRVMKIGLGILAILAVTLVLYWTSRPKQPEAVTQTPEVTTQTSNPPPESLTPQAMEAKGDEYYQAKDYQQAVAWFRKAAEAGEPLGMTNLGYVYENGYGVEKDHKEAITWYRKAAEAGDAQGMNNLGYMYGNGYGVDKDYKQAVIWYRKAATAGKASGMANLGYMYVNGLGVDKDYKQAVAWYRKAAEAGDAVGMNNLGWMYRNGYGVDKDYKQAVTWYRKAAEAGNASGTNHLGKDYQQAVAWFRKAAEPGELLVTDLLVPFAFVG